MLKPRRLIIVS